ncbi:MAG: hypothetical protein A2804_00980 [Candidatus Pacebacteria bacterium RIFCSPHIGHO2_01_FULL_46_10]|nr:MAG: hypothetical protein A2804_00980 [Candidatus Pacebacteria bacterium RIFCSPHIGHO2_01_FULL_46_10]
MQEHPVPQNVTSYEFHLIGNMTLKQFFELASGGMLAFLTYSSNLPQIFKFPLIVIFILAGGALAFLPLEERPLDQWFLAFVRAIYNPTKFNWKKSLRIPDLFSYTRSQTVATAPVPMSSTKSRSSRAQAYFESIAKPVVRDEFDQEIHDKVAALQQLYDTTPAAKDVSPSHGGPDSLDEYAEKPSLVVTMHNLHAQDPSKMSGIISVSKIKEQKELKDRVLPGINKTVTIAREKPISVARDTAQGIKPERIVQPQKMAPDVLHYHSDQVAFSSQAMDTVTKATVNTTLPFPKTPTTPNVVVGMVLDKQGKIVENAIIEIQKADGFPVRALKTNRLGQFFSTSPLKSGEYRITTEKDGFTFDPITLSMNNAILGPLEIRAKN